jgi:hypothetical protein
MAATMEEEELGPAAALWEPERLGWPQSATLDWDNLPGGVTHLCP